jgi:c-di-GMP-binding flagellar brake protein YcgR
MRGWNNVQSILPQVCQPLKLWERIEIVVSNGTDAGRYLARIEDFSEKGIVISKPEFVEGGTLLRQNLDVIVEITRKDAAYQFHSRIRRVKKQAKTIYLLTPPAAEAKRIQRRQYVRIEFYTRVSYANLTKNKQEFNARDRITWQESNTVNISGGGILIKAGEDLSPKDLLLLNIGFFTEIGLPDIVAAICRRTFHQEKDFFAGIEFLRSEKFGRYFNKQKIKSLPRSAKKFDLSAQNKLVAYIFQLQIELRKKGLL